MIPWYGLLILFPLFCALIGWFTNKIAVKMIFYPIEPVQTMGLRFQGVLPKHNAHFSREMALVVSTDFMTTSEMVERLDIEELKETVRPIIDRVFAEVVEDLKDSLTGPQQAMMSNSVIEAARAQVEKELEKELPSYMEQVGKKADQMVDLTEFVTRKLIEPGPAKVVELISHLGRKELKFIEYYGGIFGFLIGLVQFGVINIFPIRFSLIIVGVLVGAVTNYLAIKMLFYPRQPKRILLLSVQGLFPKRQQEIATEIAQAAADEFIVTDEIFKLLAHHLLPAKADRAALDKVEAAFNHRFPPLKAMLDVMLQPEQMQELRQRLLLHYERLMPEVVGAVVKTAAQQLDMNAILKQKVSTLSKLRFEDIIRGLFKEEELYLVLYGALLGGLMGAVQLGLLLLKHWV